MKLKQNHISALKLVGLFGECTTKEIKARTNDLHSYRFGVSDETQLQSLNKAFYVINDEYATWNRKTFKSRGRNWITDTDKWSRAIKQLVFEELVKKDDKTFTITQKGKDYLWELYKGEAGLFSEVPHEREFCTAIIRRAAIQL